MITTTCRNPACRKPFEAQRASAKFCSGACRVAAHRTKAGEFVPSQAYWHGKVPTLKGDRLELAESAAAKIASYSGRVTLRQVYYRLVADNTIPNTEASYKRLGDILTDARKAGIIEWDAMEDRGRNIGMPVVWNGVPDFKATMRRWYDEDRWNTQERRVAVIVEKAALAGVIEPVCNRWQVPFIAARGYASATLVADASVKLFGHYVFYFGDHDPSGVDMTRDWEDRLDGFCACAYVQRVALTRDQIEQHALPPQPVKNTDARAEGYKAQHGSGVWELDALPPDVLTALVEKTILGCIDQEEWDRRDAEIEAVRARL